MQKVLVFNSSVEIFVRPENETFVHKMNQIADEFVCVFAKYDDIFMVLNSTEGFVYIGKEKVLVTDFDLVYFKQTLGCAEYAAALSSFLQVNGIPYICDEVTEAMSLSKITEYARLDERRLPIPKTVIVHRFAIRKYVTDIVDTLGLPLIMKDSLGRKGLLNFRVANEKEIVRIAEENQDIDFIFQEFIPNNGDYRLLVLGQNVRVAIHRERSDDNVTHINTAKDSVASLISPSDLVEYCELACSAANIMRRQIAGVDLMVDARTGHPKIIEVNDAPQIASGRFTEEKLLATHEYMRELLSDLKN
jgi:glutathione synthase/RimK-type ligase-like ATP-grasp enzyme